VRLVRFDECKKFFFDSFPLLNGFFADYVRLNISSLVAFYFSTPHAYSVYATVLLLIARLTNPVTLISRPLIPAYIDAIMRDDHRWLTMLRRMMAIIAAVFAVLTILTDVLAAFYPFGALRMGAVTIDSEFVRPYLVSAVLLLVSVVFLVLLSAIYLGAQQIGLYSRVSLTANVVAVLLGTIAMTFKGPASLLGTIALCNALAAVYLAWGFFSDPVNLGSYKSARRAGPQSV
jgi:hypothetical protein